jgi:hypothetical protein
LSVSTAQHQAIAEKRNEKYRNISKNKKLPVQPANPHCKQNGYFASETSNRVAIHVTHQTQLFLQNVDENTFLFP